MAVINRNDSTFRYYRLFSVLLGFKVKPPEARGISQESANYTTKTSVVLRVFSVPQPFKIRIKAGQTDHRERERKRERKRKRD